MDNLDFLDGQSPAEPTAAATAPQETAPASEPAADTAATAPQAEGPARGPDGKFVSKAPTEAATASDVAPQAPASPPEAAPTLTAEPAKAPDGFVPVAALQELRREFQAFRQSVQQQPPPPAPDPYEDPEAFVVHQQEQMAATNFGWSYRLLAAQHGEGLAEQVKAWAGQKAESDPHFYQRALSSNDPFGFAMEEWKRDQVLSKLSDPALLDKFLALASGQAAPLAASAAASAVAAPQSPAAPPPSITSAPSAGGIQHVPLGQQEVYGAVFQ